jgi:phosphatidylserine/phosphatidylglycerophosphate/cardiolipin synthase-like enzyme
MLQRMIGLGGAVFIPLILLAAWLQQLPPLQAQVFTTAVSETILIDAVLYDGYEVNDVDEAVALRNTGNENFDLSGWFLKDGEATDAQLPQGTRLLPGEVIWVAKNEDAFFRQFGFLPDVIVTSWPRLANTGDEVILADPEHQVVDILVYGNGDSTHFGWSGPAVQPYSAGGLFAKEGQILYRKREQGSGLPVPDTNSAEDWAQSLDDPINGRRVRYPAWDLDEFQQPVLVTQSATLTVAIAPDNGLETLVDLIDAARESVSIETLTIENVAIGESLVSAAKRGVSVKLLLEGSPVGNLTSQEKYICQRIEEAGGQCWFMIRDDEQRINDRYRYLHAKFILIDHRQVAISSENLSPNSLPDDDKSDGTWGRRGVILITNASGVISRMQSIFDRDLDPQKHVDIFRWEPSNPDYGAPPLGFKPVTESGGISYTVRYPSPAVFHGQFTFELQHSPENSLRDLDGLLRLVDRSGLGDTLLIQQLQERPHWGPSDSNVTDDPNPRVEAYIAAARRGAKVRLLLDGFFDDAGSEISNSATCRMVNKVALEDGLQLSCALGNPTGLGIHNKMILAHVAGQGYVHVGSLNGTELSSKGNREVALLVQSDGAYEILSDMFGHDMPYQEYLPMVRAAYLGPAAHILISEVLYDPYGPDDVEFVELVNPTSRTIDMSDYGLGDATSPQDYEDLRRFPLETTIQAGEVLIIATSGYGFWQEYGLWPDFEILETSEMVPNLVDDPTWGDPSTFLRLGNLGDEVILRDRNDLIIDAVVYGSGELPGTIRCLLLSGTNHSLERYPYWRDTDSCPDDFRDWPFPSPGQLP